jgi:flagellar biosynthetic protein FliQ
VLRSKRKIVSLRFRQFSGAGHCGYQAALLPEYRVPPEALDRVPGQPLLSQPALDDTGKTADHAPMNEADALDIMQFAIWTVLTAAGPSVAVAMVVGIVIALVQALTQIQEVTLTFVPKIVAILIVVAFSGSFIGGQISAFSNVIFQRIEQGF